MADNVPAYDAYDAYLKLRHRFIERIEDYFLVCQFGGFSGPDDFGQGPAHLAFMYEAAMHKVNHLIEVVRAMDARANLPIGTSVQESMDLPPSFSDMMELSSDMHDRLKPLRELAKAWEKDIGEEVDKQVGKPVGRPKGSSMYPTSESIVKWLGPHIKALWDEGKHPTRDLVAERVGFETDTMMHHVRQFFIWERLLETLKDSASN